MTEHLFFDPFFLQVDGFIRVLRIRFYPDAILGPKETQTKKTSFSILCIYMGGKENK